MFAQCFLIMESCLINERQRPQPGAVRFLDALIQNRVPFVILTNRSAQLRTAMAEGMNRAGFHNVAAEMFYTSTMAAVDAIIKKYPDKKNAGYIGGKGMLELLRIGGFALNMDRADWVFVGSDHNSTYNDYSYCLKLVERGAYIVSVDPSPTERSLSGTLIGSGSVVKMLEYASGTRAIEAGIPAPLIVSRALKYLRKDISDAVLITAHPETEIVCGNNAGIRTVLFAPAMDEKENALLRRIHPDYVAEDLSALLR